MNIHAIVLSALSICLATSVACNKSQPRIDKNTTADSKAAAESSSSVRKPMDSASVSDVFAVLPDFELVDTTDNAFGSRQLYTKAWIANLIYTRGGETTQAQTAKMFDLQEQLRNTPAWKDVRLVSITVDPQFDTADILRSYAQQASADNSHWKFLTGAQDEIRNLSTEGFKLAVGQGDASSSAISHSSMFVLVDPYLRVRGYYDVVSSDDELERLHTDLEKILRERAPIPSEIATTKWLESRKRAQFRTAGRFQVNYDFSFQDRINESGIRFRNRVVDDAGRDYKSVHYDHGNGVAVADVDSDGRYDIYFVTQVGGNELWKNTGDGRFEDITDRAGVALANRIGVTASFGDVDNDGDPDLFVTTVREGNVLFENDGTGVFRDISQEAGVGHVGHSSAAVLFDFDRDGLLDIFLTNVGRYTTDERTAVTKETVRRDGDEDYDFYVSVLDAFGGHLKPDERNEPSILYRNLGNNKFQDVTAECQIKDVSWSGDATPVDFNQDMWPDLYLLDMQGHDEYYENVEGKYFRKRSDQVFPNTPWGSMGVKSFDYDNDGDMDLFITDMHSDMSENVDPNREKRKSTMQWPKSYTQADGRDIWGNAFFQNQGDGTFQEISDRMGAENYWPWGISVADLNADGYDDVFIASSMNYPFRYGINTVLLNNRGERFLDSEFLLGVEPRPSGEMAPWFEIEVTGKDREHPLAKRYATSMASAGVDPDSLTGRMVVWSAKGTRSSVIFDLDDDGDLDIVTNEFNYEPMVLTSDLANRNNPLKYLKVKLRGTVSNRDGLGAVITIQAGAKSYVKVHDGQSGYLSQSLYPLYFGLDGASTVDRIEVRWPSGIKQTMSGPIELNTTLDIIESETTSEL